MAWRARSFSRSGTFDSSMIGARAVPAPSPPGVSHPQTPRSADRLTDNAMTLSSWWSASPERRSADGFRRTSRPCTRESSVRVASAPTANGGKISSAPTDEQPHRARQPRVLLDGVLGGPRRELVDEAGQPARGAVAPELRDGVGGKHDHGLSLI